jgi:hypothetical protein
MNGKTHNESYGEWQDKYFKSGDEKLKDYCLSKMYETAVRAAGNYIRKYAKGRGLAFQNIDCLAHDSAMYIIEQHIRKPDFKIERLSAYIHFGVIKTLFKDKEQEMNEVSFDTLEDVNIGRGK